jgi:hypothetical protein
MKHRFRVIALDVDGTMVGSDHVVSERLRRAVARVQDTGATVSLATGRMMRSAKRFAREAGAAGPVICYQGALTFVPETGEVLRHERVPVQVARSAIGALKAAGVHINVYVEDEVYVERATEWATGYASRMEIGLRVVASLGDLAESGPTLILAVSEKEHIESIWPALAARLGAGARVTRSLPHFCEVGSPNAGKEQALDHLSGFLKVPQSDFVAFGDGAGDAAMLRWAGLGVAMAGGHADALAAADRTAPGPEEDGVAQVIEELLADGSIGA